jgi:hypothetical protein
VLLWSRNCHFLQNSTERDWFARNFELMRVRRLSNIRRVQLAKLMLRCQVCLFLVSRLHKLHQFALNYQLIYSYCWDLEGMPSFWMVTRPPFWIVVSCKRRNLLMFHFTISWLIMIVVRHLIISLETNSLLWSDMVEKAPRAQWFSTMNSLQLQQTVE